MKPIQKLSLTGLAVLSATVLPGCSEDDVKEALADNNATGLYVGCTGITEFGDIDTDTGCSASQRTLVALVQGNGKYHLLYSDVGDEDELGGVIAGTYSLGGGGFTSNDGIDFQIGGTTSNVTVSADGPYSISSLRGMDDGSFSGGIGGTFALLSDTSKYNTPFAFPASSRGYTGSAGSLNDDLPISLSLQSNGSFTGNIDTECTFDGTLTATGKALAIASITFENDATNCEFSAQTLTGVAYEDDGDIYIIGIDSTDTNGMFIKASSNPV